MKVDQGNNKVLTDEEIQKTEEDMYEKSAEQIHALYAIFRKMGYALSQRKKRAAVRVLEAVLFEPLEKVKLEGKAEEELFALCHQIMYHKNKVTEYAIKRKMEKEQTNG